MPIKGNTKALANVIYLLTYMESLIWYKREQLAQVAFPTIASSCPPIDTTKREGFYVKLFLIRAYPLEEESKMSSN